MLFEELCIALLCAVAFFMIVLPIYKFIKPFIGSSKKDPVKEAKQRLYLAKAELEAAKLNKQAEECYEQLYQDALDETENNSQKKV